MIVGMSPLQFTLFLTTALKKLIIISKEKYFFRAKGQERDPISFQNMDSTKKNRSFGIPMYEYKGT